MCRCEWGKLSGRPRRISELEMPPRSLKVPQTSLRNSAPRGTRAHPFSLYNIRKSSATEKELLNLVGLTDSTQQFKWNYMISEREKRLNDLPVLRQLAHNVTPRLIYIETSRIPQKLEKLAYHRPSLNRPYWLTRNVFIHPTIITNR